MTQPYNSPPEVLTSDSVTLINAFTVPVDESERFLERWKANARVMAIQPGFIRARMHRSLVSEAELRFVNVAEWESGTTLAQAQANPAFRASVQRMTDDRELHVTARPSVYELALEVHPDSAAEALRSHQDA
jgi:heme-degrading monooxygenase HmoA